MTAEQRVRIEDYLNDKLQSQADLDNLDTLLNSVKEQQELLKEQLRKAQDDHSNAKKDAESRKKDLVTRIETYRSNQNDISKRLQALTNSEVSDDAVSKFEATVRKASELEIAENYVSLLADVERLASEATASFEKTPEIALRPYTELQNVIVRLHRARPDAEEAAPHLIDEVEGIANKLWEGMKASFATDLEETLKKIGWPTKDADMDEATQGRWVGGIDRLLDLQKPLLETADASGGQYVVLLPLEVMTRPLSARFRYHFSGDRPTNRLDKPEYFLSHILEILNDYDGFFAFHLQPVLAKHFGGTSLAFNPVYTDSTSALITAVLPMLRTKLRDMLPTASKQPQLMSHLMHELMNFDEELRRDWQYGYAEAENWKGIAGEILDTGWFERWLEIEKDFALKRYQSIIESKDSGEIDFDSVDTDVTKPTKAAIRVNDLLETITDRYRPLASFSQKIKFVVDIQLAIFDRYHDRLNEALEAFITLSNPIARKVQGFSRDDAEATLGVQGLERLCRIYGSAEYLARKMTDWANDVFFLELWEELQFRSQEHSSPEDLNVSVESVSKKSAEDGALFDEVCTHYERLQSRTEDLITEQIFGGLRDAFRPYNRISPWTVLEIETAVSAELEPALQQASQAFEFLSKCLANTSLRRIARAVLRQIQTWLWDHIIYRNNFSTAGVEQLSRDLDALYGPFDRACGQGFGKSSMKILDEALTLMKLPVDGQDVSLRIVEQRVFQSNEEARAVLVELDLDVLAESHARLLLQKRVELGT